MRQGFKTHSCLVIGLMVLACMPAAIYLGKLPGRRTVAALCAHDGGSTIYNTTYSDGYVNLAYRQDCVGCVQEVALQKFSWVAYEVPDGRRYSNDGVGGFYRLELSNTRDPRCQAWRTGALGDIKILRKRYGIDDKACVAATYLDSMPQSYTYQETWSEMDLGWFNPVKVLEIIVTDQRQDEVLARYKQYFYTATVTAMMDMGAGIGNPDARCSSGGSHFEPLEFRQTVLRDPTKINAAQRNARGRN